MTYGELKCILDKNHIPDNTHLLSNSGWECGETEMNGVYYNPDRNEVWFGQGDWLGEIKEYKSDEFFILYPFYDENTREYKDFKGRVLFEREYEYDEQGRVIG